MLQMESTICAAIRRPQGCNQRKQKAFIYSTNSFGWQILEKSPLNLLQYRLCHTQFITLFPKKLSFRCCMQTFPLVEFILNWNFYMIGTYSNSKGHLHPCQDYIRLLWTGEVTNGFNSKIQFYLWYLICCDAHI